MSEVEHPKAFLLNGTFYKVVALTPLTESEAVKIVRRHLQANPQKKTDIGETITIKTRFDAETKGYL